MGQIDDLLSDVIRNTVPHPAWSGAAILKASKAKRLISSIPSVECVSRYAKFRQSVIDQQMRLLDKSDDLELFGGRVSHSRPPPSVTRQASEVPPTGPIMFFSSNRFSRVRSETLLDQRRRFGPSRS